MLDMKLFNGENDPLEDKQVQQKSGGFGQIFDNVGAWGNAAYANTKEIGLSQDIRDLYERLYTGDYASDEEYNRLSEEFQKKQDERRKYKQEYEENMKVLNQNDSYLKDFTEIGGTVQGIGTQLKDTAMAAGAGAVTMGALGAGAGGIGAIPAALVGAAKGATWGNRVGAFHQAYQDAKVNAIDAWEKVLQEGGTAEQAEQAYNDALIANLPTEALDVIGNLYFGSKILGNAVSSNMAQKLSKSALGKTAEKVSRFDLPAVVGTNVAKKFGSTAGKIAGGVTASTLEGIGESIQEPWQDYATERAVDIQRRQYDPTNKLNKDVRDFSVLGDGGLLDYYTTPEGRETAWKSFKMGAAFGGIGSALSASQFTKLGTAHSDSIQSGKREADWIEKQGLLKDAGNLERYNNVKETMANVYDLSEDEKADLSVEDVARMYHEYYTNLFGQGGNRQEQNAVSQADFLNEITGEETARRGLMGDTATKYIDEFGIRPDNETLVGINDNQQVLSEEQVQETLNQDEEETTGEEIENKEGIKAKASKPDFFDDKTSEQEKEEKASSETQNVIQKKKKGIPDKFGNWKKIEEDDGFDHDLNNIGAEAKYENTKTGRITHIKRTKAGYQVTDVTDPKDQGTTRNKKGKKKLLNFLKSSFANQKTKFMSDGTQVQEQVSQALPQEDGVIATKDITKDENGDQWFNGKKIQSNKAQVIHSMQDLHDYYKTHKDLMSKDLYAEISRQMMRFGIGNANNTEIVLDLTNREAGGFGSETTIRTDPNDENSAVAKAIVRLYAGADLATAAHEMAHLGWMNLSDQDRATFTKWAEKTQGEFIAKILGMDYDQNFRSYLIEALTNRESQTSQDLWAKIKREGAVQQTLGILNGQNYGLAVEERFAWEFSNWYAQGYIKGAKPRNIIERILNKACATLQGALNLLSDTNRYLNGENGYNGGDINNIFTNMSTRGIGQQRQTVAPQEQVETVTRMDYAPEMGYDLAQGLPNVADSELGMTLDEEPEQNLSGNYGTTRVNQRAERTAQEKTKTGYGEGVSNNNETLEQYRERMKKEAEQKKEEKKQNYTPTPQYKPKERNRRVGGYEQTSPQGETLEQYKQREAEEAEKYKVPTSLKGVRKLLTIVKNRKEGWQRALQSLKQIDPRKFRSIKTQIGNDLWGVSEDYVSDGNDLWGQPQQQSLFGKEFEETKSEPKTQVEETKEETKKTNTVEEPSLFDNQTEQVSEETEQSDKTTNKSVENSNLTSDNQNAMMTENQSKQEVAESGETENTRGTENLQGNVGEVQGRGTVRTGDDSRTGEGRVGQNSVEERSEGNGKDISLLKNSKFKSVYNARNEKKTEVKDWRDLSDSDEAKQVFVDALNASKEANKDYGVYVSEQTVESLKDCKVVLHKNKMAGFAITPDGNIVGVFSSPKNPIRGILNDMIFIAHMMGGNSMDCFGSFLLRGYRACGFTPVARTTFDEAYYPADNPANNTIRKEKPDVFFLVKDNDNNTTYLDKMNKGEYKNDQIAIDNIPLIDSEDSYGDALGFQGQVLEEIQKKENKNKSTKEVADSLRPKEETATETQETPVQNSQVEQPVATKSEPVEANNSKPLEQKKNITEGKTFYRGITKNNDSAFSGNEGGVVWFSEDKKFAEAYAKDSGGRLTKGSTIIEADLSLSNPFDLGVLGDELTDRELYNRIEKQVMQDKKDGKITSKQALEIIKQCQYLNVDDTWTEKGEKKKRHVYSHFKEDNFFAPFKQNGYDSVMGKELGSLTYGVFDKSNYNEKSSNTVNKQTEQVRQTSTETEKPKKRTFTGIRNKAVKDFSKNYIGREEALKNPDLSFARAYYDIVTTLEEGEGDYEELPLNQDGELSPSKAKAYFNKALTVLKYGADNGNPECNYWLAELASGEESPNIDMFDTVEEAIEERFEFSEEDIAQMYKVASDGGIKVAKSKLPNIDTQTEVVEETSQQTETSEETATEEGTKTPKTEKKEGYKDPRVMKYIPKDKHEAVDFTEKDLDDGSYWVYLKDGWCNGEDVGTGIVHEDTLKEIKKQAWKIMTVEDFLKERQERESKKTTTKTQTSPKTETAQNVNEDNIENNTKTYSLTEQQNQTNAETKQTTIDKSDKNYQKAVELVMKYRGLSPVGLRFNLKEEEGIDIGSVKAEQYLVQMENDGIVEHGDEGSLRLLKKNPSTKMQEAGQNAENQTPLTPQVEEELENLFWKLIRKKQFHGMDSRWESGKLDYYKSLSNRRQGKEFNPEFIKGDKAFLNAIKNVNDYIHEKFPQYKNVYRGVDGHWRFEFSDKDAHFINGFEKLSGKTLDTTLDKILKHDNLYKFYSKLKGMPVHLVRNTKMQELMEDTENQYYAMYDPDERAIYINSDMFESSDELRNSLLHEIQHAIQDIEGFANGTNDNAYNNDYDFSEGEKQAVLTEKRSNMSDEELQQNPRSKTLNPNEKTIIQEQRPVQKVAKSPSTKFQSSGQNNLGYIDKQKDIYSVTFTKSAQQNAENKKKMDFYRKNKSYWRENKDAQTGSITFTRALPYQQHQKTIIYDEINGKKVGKRKKAKWREYYEAFKDHMIKWLFNDKHFLEKAARNVGAIESYMRMMVMKDQGAVAGAAIEDGIVKHNGKNGERTKSLNSIIEAVGEENQTDFLNYCEAYRVLDLEKRNIYQKMTPKDARDEIAKVKRSKNAKLFEQQRQYFVEYNHELLWVLVDGGFITEQQYNKFIENDPNFIPLAKNMDELEGYVDGFKDSKTMINVAHPMHKIGTSMREVANPFLEMQKRTVEYYVKASRNKAGHIFVHDIAEAIAQNAKGDVVAQNQGMVRKLASRDKNGKPISHDNKQYVFYVWENGEKQYYQVADREIYVALKSFDAEQMGALSKIMNATAGKASRLVRNTATMTPDFGLRNLVRDNMEAFISSEHGFLPLVDSLWGMYQMANDTQWFKEYQRMNGEHLSLNRDGEDVATVEHDIKDNVKFYKTYVPLFKKDLHEFMDKDRSKLARAKSLLKLVALDIVPLQSIYKANKRLNDYLETGTRIGEYRNARMGYKGLKGRLFETSGSTIWTTDMDLSRAKNTEMIAAYKSKDITLNFGQHGVLGKELNRYIPFFNASLQGIYKLGNTLDDMIHAEDARRRQELMFKCALMGAMGMAAALAGQGDDDYDEAPDYEHENFWILPNGIRIPKDQLFGKLIGGTVEKATAQYLKDGDVKKLELVQDILGNFAIDKCVPALVDLGWGTIGNYDSFKKKSVTPEYMADKLGYLQKDLSTSKAGADISETIYKVTDGLFKALGYNSGGVDIGAKKVDFVISKTLSNLGKYVTSLWELTGGNEKMTRGAEVEDKGGFAETSKELPYPLNQIVGTFATNRNSFQSISDFYERHRELKKLSSDESIMSKNEKKAWEAYQAAYKKDKQYRDALKAIKLDKSLTGAQKRQKADKIFKQQISMARKLHDWEKKHGLV